ncbi:TonB-dependent receptor domain-containing protein [Massilia soli]|uniref:TonB-dependent receptor n=1 Tax=Massilia soli TaxID=2792854 RepID=A0ABS7SMI4_9BURK|nr:TonB-dependent receptor [Massilia soli]MBZ2207382.1 TonB-dependent receptor [Massilia soli]
MPFLAGALVFAVPAQAQEPVATPTAQPAPAPKPGAPVETVTVTAVKQSNRIDRQVYDVKADPATSNDSVADTLNKVPSLAVDGDGAVTLRGKGNVQILVDGKPSAMMQGENRGAALSGLPAADLESVEVINNPGAQFGNEGGGGPIINLVMRRDRTPGGFASVNANLGTNGRYNTAVFGNYTTGRMSMQGSLSRRYDTRGTSGETVRERIDPVTGEAARSTQSSLGGNENDSTGFNGSISYNLGERDVVGMTASYNEFNRESASRDRYVGTGATGSVTNDYLRSNQGMGANKNVSLGGRLDHKGERPGELFKLDLRVSSSDSGNDTRYGTLYTVRPSGALDSMTRLGNGSDTRVADLTGDYERPLGTGLVKLGFKLARTSNSLDTRFFDIDSGTLAESVNRARTNRFELDDSTAAVYGSYQYRIDSQWSVLGGLRAEYNELDMHQVTTSIRASNSSTDLIPSAFVTYGLSDDTTLRLSYAHRIRRPNAGELNPFVIYRDELNISSGNPNLKPSGTDSLELGVETKLGKVQTTVRLYARRDADLISERRILQANDVLLTTRDNAGDSRSAGVEFTFGGRATEKLTLNASGNIGYSDQSVLGRELPGDDRRSAVSVTGRGRIGYQMDANNQFGMSLNATGKQLFGEGYRKPTRTADLNYRRKVTQALSFVLNVNDVFDSQKMETVTETDRLREQSIRRFGGRTVFAGLSYRFGSFSGAAARGPGGPGGPGRPGPGGGGSGPRPPSS